MGHLTSSYTNGINSFAQGQRVISNADNNVTFGLGGTGTWLDNSQTNSFMVGFDSDAPTLFVGTASGNGTTGNVGIGGPGYTPLMTPNPLEKLEVWNGNIAQTNVDQVATTTATTGNSSTNLLGLSPGTCPVFGLTTNNLGVANTISGIANSFVQVGVDQTGTYPGPVIRWDDQSVLSFKPNSAIGGCNTLSVIEIADPSGPWGNSVVFNLNGDGVYNTSWTLSDKRYKENIRKIENSSTIINSLEGYSYRFTEKARQERNFSNRNQFGLIAQNVAEVIPDAVLEMHNGYLAVNYSSIIPILVEAFKAQQVELDSLKNSNKATETNPPLNFKEYVDSIVEIRIDSLLQTITIRDNKIDSFNLIVDRQEKEIQEVKSLINKISKCLETANLCNNINTQEGELMDLPQLFQNTPNPFSSETQIRYYLPKKSLPAVIEFFDVNGRIFHKVSLTEEGTQTLTISSQVLPSGTIYYHLSSGNRIYGPLKMAIIRN